MEIKRWEKKKKSVLRVEEKRIEKKVGNGENIINIGGGSLEREGGKTRRERGNYSIPFLSSKKKLISFLGRGDGWWWGK